MPNPPPQEGRRHASSASTPYKPPFEMPLHDGGEGSLGFGFIVIVALGVAGAAVIAVVSVGYALNYLLP